MTMTMTVQDRHHVVSRRTTRQAWFSRLVRELVAKHGLTAELEAEAASLLVSAGVPEQRVNAALQAEHNR